MIPTLRLPRGAALAADPAEGARSFAAGFWFPIGSRHEAPRERGFVHFVEHMAFKGTLARSAAQLSREVERVGGYLNAFTDRDSLCLHCQVPAERWALALDVLSDMAFRSTFRPEEFEREREVIVSEILAGQDDPEERSHDEFLSAIWPGDPLSRKIAGETEDIRRITREDLYSFYRSEFSPASLLVTTAGPVPEADLANELATLIESRSGAPQGGVSSEPSARAVQGPAFTRIGSYELSRMEQVHYYEAVQLEPPFDEADYYALSAANGALGEAGSSRLFLSLREEKGLCYSVYSAFAMSRTECLWMASAASSSADLPELASEMDRQLDLAGSEGLSEEECRDSVSRLVGSFEVALDDMDFRMRRIARELLFSGSASAAEEARAEIAAVSPEMVRASCERLLAGRGRARFAYGSVSRRDARKAGLSPARRGLRGPIVSRGPAPGQPPREAARRG